VDGKRWNKVSSASFGGPDDQQMFGVTSVGSALIAVGMSRPHLDAAVWFSVDGRAWNRIHSRALGGLKDQGMLSVARGGPGMVATGFDSSNGSRDAAVWVSRDGFKWTEFPPDPSVFGGTGTQEMVGLAPGGPGLVGVGYSEQRGDLNGAVWVSADGITWNPTRRDTDLVGLGEQRIKSAISFGSHLIAVGREEGTTDEDAVVWIGTLTA
jgi:hypothetical protein